MVRQPLPLECVLIILGFLSKEYDTDTMARLLCVSRNIGALTLPFLYGDCFKLRMHSHRPHSRKRVSTTLSQLIRTLLKQVHPQDQIPGLLQAVYFSEGYQEDLQQTVDQPTPVFKYGCFIRKLATAQDLRKHLIDIRGNTDVVEYSAAHQLYDKYVAQGMIVRSCDEYEDDEDIADALEMDIYRQLMWTLCQDHMDSIEELSIPLSDIERYIEHVDRFKSLANINFRVEKITEVPEYMRELMPHEDYIQYGNEMEMERDRLFRTMVHFVQQHTSIHKHVLRQVDLPRAIDFSGTSRHSIADVEFEIMSLLPPLQNLQSIDNLNLCQSVARLSDTNLDRVESIKLRHPWGTNIERALEVLSNSQPPFLSHFRALKHLETRTLGPDMFQWAVLEKKQLDAKLHQESALGQHPSSWQHVHHHNLMPLQSVELIHKTPLRPVQELNDLAFAFRDSLEKLTIRDKEDARPDANTLADLGALPAIVHGCGWTLPHLRTLDFHVLYSQLQFDLDALQRFCALESLRLADGIRTYNYRDIRSWPSFNLPRLKRLILEGSPALHFNLNSLHHSPCLEHLKLSTPFTTFGCYMPSPEDMCEDSKTECGPETTIDDHGESGTPDLSQGYHPVGRRPRLTWNWYLPNLQGLYLTAVFAHKFNFQWLQHLPNLQILVLNKYSRDSNHERGITLEDLLINPRQQQESDGEIASVQYLSLPKLRLMTLLGQWSVPTKVLEILCLFVVPNLHEIYFGSECVGFQLCEWVTSVRTMPRLKTARLEQESSHEIWKLGLSRSRQDGDPNKRHLKHDLYGGIYWDVLDA